MADLLSDVAHKLTGLCGGTCCHITGGRQPIEVRSSSGQLVGGDNGKCECRDTAKEIIAMIESKEAGDG